MKRFFTPSFAFLVLIVITTIAGCVDSIVDSSASSSISIKITSPSTNDTITYSGEAVEYTLVQSSGIKFLQLFINGEYAEHIYAEDDGSQPEITIALDTTYIGTRISFYVIYYDQNDGFAVSDTVENLFVAEYHNPPYTPYNFSLDTLAVTSSTMSVNLSWKDSTEREARYEIFRRTANTGYPLTAYLTSDAGTNNINDENLEIDSVYYYKIRGVNIYGVSDFSSEINTLNSYSSTVPAPGNLRATATGTKVVKLTWQDNSSNENYFGVERKSSSTSFENIGKVLRNTTSFTDSANGLSAGIEYTYRIKAYSNSDSSWSAEVTIQTPSYTLSTPVIDTLKNTSSTTVLVKWNSNDSRSPQMYIYRLISGASNYVLLGESDYYLKEFEDKTIVPGKLYYYKLITNDGTYSSEYSAIKSIVTQAIQLEAPSISASWYLGDNKIQLNWEFEQEANKFIIERTDLSSTVLLPETFEVDGDLRTYNDAVTAGAGKQFQYRIKAVDDYSTSEYSDAYTVTCW